MTIAKVIENLRSTAHSREQVFGKDDSSVKLANDMADAVDGAFALLIRADRALNAAKVSEESPVRINIKAALYGE